MTEKIQCVVIGAGVVGLSIARELCIRGVETCVVEKEATFGTGTSSRNSEVIHAGLYYKANSLKARLCVEGRRLLYQYCRQRNIPHAKTGKLIVAKNQQQLAVLESIKLRAFKNGVDDLRFLSQAEISEKEPELNVQNALYSPSSGIIDSHQFMLSLIADIENNGGFVVYNTSFLNAKQLSDKWAISLQDSQVYKLNCHHLINCGGLYADKIAHNIDGETTLAVPEVKYAKGNYFSYHGKHSFNHLIYPVPENDGLGIHLTLDLAGQIKFGPDVEWTDNLDYQVNTQRNGLFFEAIKSYWPNVEKERLHSSYCGIRPKLINHNMAEQDFIIRQDIKSETSALINLFGIESPGLTASLSIAKTVANMVTQ